jgi:hypothetical protein
MNLSEVAFDSFVLLQSYWSVERALNFIRGVDASHVIVEREESNETYYYLFSQKHALELLSVADPRASIHIVLDLHEYTAVDVLDASASADDAPDRVVVLDAGEVVGFFDAMETSSLESSPLRGSTRDRFEAYPSLTAPEQVKSDESFDIFVGFRGDPDPELIQSGRMIFEDIEPADECLIRIIGDGVDLDRNHDLLPFRENAQVRFTCRPKAGFVEAVVKAHYLHRQQIIGTAERRVAIAQQGAEGTLPSGDLSPNPCRLELPSPDRDVDLTVTVTYSTNGDLQWTFTAPKPRIETKDPILTSLQGAKEFAADLIDDLRTEDHTGNLAANILENKGQQVFRLMPPEFMNTLKSVHDAIGRTPTLLLLTNETYVPWEIAYLPQPLDPGAPRFLAAQTQMGRWLDDQNVILPPAVKLEIRRLTAVASKYGLGTSQRELPEALAERELLVKDWKAVPLEAKKAEVTDILRGAKIPGHLVHFAVHGISSPAANHQAILMADNTEIRASSMIGSFNCGEDPRFVFVVLNACQVGTAGASLGQAAGFPGTLVKGGVLGFIAPLWEVNDKLAFNFAAAFYNQTFTEGKPVGSVLQQQRRSYDPAGSTTPIAYIYYGHPALRLTNAIPKE